MVSNWFLIKPHAVMRSTSPFAVEHARFVRLSSRYREAKAGTRSLN
jgi:hypothetical protein